MDGLADVGVDAPPLLHGGDHGGKVVVGEDHVRRALGHVRARFAHGAADVGSPEGGGVVDAVAGHGDDAAFFLPGLDDAELMLRGHAGVDGDPLDLLLQGLLRQEIQPRPVDGLVPRPEDVQLAGDGHRRLLVVAGDHNGPDARRRAALHRRPGFGPGRVHHADEAHKGQVVLQGLGVKLLGGGSLLPLGHGQDPQSLARQDAVFG